MTLIFLTNKNVMALWPTVTMKNTALSCKFVFVYINDFDGIVVF